MDFVHYQLWTRDVVTQYMIIIRIARYVHCIKAYGLRNKTHCINTQLHVYTSSLQGMHTRVVGQIWLFLTLFRRTTCFHRVCEQTLSSNYNRLPLKGSWDALQSQMDVNSHFYCTMLCTARTLLSQDVCPICLSVTLRYCVETAKHIITLFSTAGSQTILVCTL